MQWSHHRFLLHLSCKGVSAVGVVGVFVDHDFWMLECLVSSLVVQLGITKLFLVGFKLLLPGCFLVFLDYLLSFC